MNATIATITTRALLGRRRFLLLLPLPVLLVGLAGVAQALGAAPEEWGRPVIVGLGVAVVLPVVALVVGTGVLGSEIDDGTIVHVLAKPLSRREILLSKLVVAIVVTFLTTAVPLFVVGMIAGSMGLALGLVLGALVGSIAYSCLFVALSLLSRRPVLLGLVYLLVWESLLGNLIKGTHVLSIQQYVLAVADGVAHSGDLLGASLSVPVGLVMAGLVSVGTTVLAIDRLKSFAVVGETS